MASFHATIYSFVWKNSIFQSDANQSHSRSAVSTKDNSHKTAETQKIQQTAYWGL